jgi:platelet-activating factor acetylhydrolase
MLLLILSQVINQVFSIATNTHFPIHPYTNKTQMSFLARLFSRKAKDAAGTQKEVSTGLKALTGRFAVGFVDVEWEDSEGLVGSEEGQEKEGLMSKEIPFVLARIYYPTAASVKEAAQEPKTEEDNSFGTWIPSSHYFPGYGYFIRLPTLVSSGIGRLLAGNVRIWAKEGLPLVSVEESGKEKLPVAIFSHGIAGIRTTYSTLCCEMASRGIIVVALEHRDGSASMTIDQKGKVFPYQAGPSGLNLPLIDYDYRAAQLRYRNREMLSTVKFIESIDRTGDFNSIVVTSSSLPQILGQFKERILLERLILTGHSFGASTCLMAAQEIKQVSTCVAWDPWMFPMPKPALAVNRTDIDTLLIINEKFTLSENDAAIQNYINAFRNTERLFGKVQMLTCGHMDQSDLASIVPHRIIRLLRPGSSIPENHHRILQANVDLVAAHLSASLPMYSFDTKWPMTALLSCAKQDTNSLASEEDYFSVYSQEDKVPCIDSIIKLETFINYM